MKMLQKELANLARWEFGAIDMGAISQPRHSTVAYVEKAPLSGGLRLPGEDSIVLRKCLLETMMSRMVRISSIRFDDSTDKSSGAIYCVFSPSEPMACEVGILFDHKEEEVIKYFRLNNVREFDHLRYVTELPIEFIESYGVKIPESWLKARFLIDEAHDGNISSIERVILVLLS